VVVGILQKEQGLSRDLAFSGQFRRFTVRELMREKYPSIIEHLALLSVKHRVPVADLFEALVSAREHGEALCQTLAIEYRGTIKKEGIFLITTECRIVGQFRVEEELLLRKNIRFENWMSTEKVRRQIEKQRVSVPLIKVIQDLRHGMKKVNLDASVRKTSTPTHICTQYGNSATITNTLIADKTGSIILCLWNEQATSVRTGDTVQIRNATVSTFKGERQLHLGKSGTLSVMKPAE
jgi:hypothetical protein